MIKKSGIYQIKNLVNNKIYIGQSINMKVRITSHKRDLKNNNHINSHLQNSYNKYGISSFEFSILEFCDRELLDEKENHWILKLKSNNQKYGYNINLPLNDSKIYSKESNRSNKLEYSDEELIAYLHEFYYMNCRIPVQRDLINSDYPSYASYCIRFGSFKEALIESDLYEFSEHKHLFEKIKYTKNSIIEEFSKFIEINGRFPNAKDIKNTKNNNLPTSGMIVKHCGSIHEIRKELGYDKESLKIKEKQESLNSLIKLYEVEGFISARLIDKSDITKCGKYYRDNFGSMKKACDMVGIPYGTHVHN